MPCVQVTARREREEYIKKNRQDVNEFEGVTDSVEALKIIHRPRKYDPLVNWIPHPIPVNRLYTELSEIQQISLAEYAESLVGGPRNDEAELIMLCLAAFTGAQLESCLKTLVAHGSFWPSLPFHRASTDLRDQLLARAEWDQENRNHILLALAWIGDEVVVDLFARWRKHPPNWRDSLYIPPEEYSREAGWELTDDGQRRDLFFHNCQKLLRGSSSSPKLFQAITPSQGSCPWCCQQLTNLVSLVPAELGMAGVFARSDRVQVTTCEVCTAFAIVFGEYDAGGHGQWSSGNSRPDYLPDDSASWDRMPRNPLRLAGPRHALFAADQFLPTTFSQVGGHPTWIQDAVYPRCAKCSKTMMFLAQVDNDDIEDSVEGMYYAFVCPGCRTTATAYQQT